MWWVTASIAPLYGWAIYLFGWRVVALIASGVVGALFGEWVVNRLRSQRQTLGDGSAVLTGVLLVGTLSPGLPLWMPAVGGCVAIVFAKMIFGGLGYNLFNPALVGRAFLMATFPVAMTTTWLKPIDAVTQATPLNLFKLERIIQVTYPDLFLGLRSGSIGELSILLIAIGALFLVWKKIIKLYIPLSVLAGFMMVAVFSEAPLLHLMTGGLWFGAFYMATDYVTAPLLPKGQIIFGLCIGALTAVIRIWGGYPEGVCYAILILNAVTPALNQWFKPTRPQMSEPWQGAPS